MTYDTVNLRSLIWWELSVLFVFDVMYKLLLLRGLQAGLAKLIGLAGETNVQVYSNFLRVHILLLIRVLRLSNRGSNCNTNWVYCFCFLKGEEQKKLDVLSNEVFINALVSSGRTVCHEMFFLFRILSTIWIKSL